MCEKPSILILLFILKIIIIFIIPFIILFRNRFSDKTLKIIYIIEIGLLLLFSILFITKNECIINSNIRDISAAYRFNMENPNQLKEKNSPDIVYTVVTNEFYKSNTNEDVYYFNNNLLPLSDKKIKTVDQDIYLKQYGNSITAAAMFVSYYLRTNIDPIEIMEYIESQNAISYENGVDFNDLISNVSFMYALKMYDISNYDLNDFIKAGRIVIAEVNYNPEVTNNLTCDRGYIIIYGVDNSNNYSILNPNDTSYDYLCPDNTAGSLSIIKANTNEQTINVTDLDKIVSRYIGGERR